MKKEAVKYSKSVFTLIFTMILSICTFCFCGNIIDNSITAEAATTDLKPSKGTLTSISISPTSFTYDGQSHSPKVTGVYGNLGAASSGTYTIGGTKSATNVGTYYITATGVSGGYYSGTSVKAKWTITKASNPISYASSQSVTKSFSTSAQTATLTAATKAQGTLTYSISSQKNSSGTAVSYFTLSSTTLTIAANTPPGTYTVVVQAYAAGNSNYYSGSKNSTVTVTVNKLSNPLTFTAAQSVSKTFSTSAQSQTLTAATNAQGTLSYAINSQKNSSDTSISYFTLNGTTLTVAANTPADTYTVVVRATAAGNTNYNSGTKDSTVTVTINKAANPLTYSDAQSVSKTFAASAQTQTLTAATNAQGTLSYAINSQKNSSNTAVSYFTLSGTTLTVDANTPADTYTVVVRATAAGNTNYNSGTKESTVTVTINKAASSVTAEPIANSLTYTGEPQVLLTPSTAEGGTMQYSLDFTNYSAEIPKATNAGSYVVYYKVAGDDNHNDTAPQTISVSIAPAGIDDVIAPEAVANLTYNGTEQSLVTPPAEEVTGGTMQYKVNDGDWSSEIPKVTDAGNYTVWYKIAGDDNHNDTAEHSINVSIEKAASSVIAAPEPNELEWSGSEQELVNAGTAEGGTMQYRLGIDGEWLDTVPALTDAGTYNVYYMVSGDDNHNDTAELGPITVTVSHDSSAQYYWTKTGDTYICTAYVTIDGVSQYVDMDVTAGEPNANGDIPYTAAKTIEGILFTNTITPVIPSFNITVQNGTFVSPTEVIGNTVSVKENTKITVEANAPEEGKTFKGWYKNDVNDILLCKNPKYTFFAGEDITVIAQYEDTADHFDAKDVTPTIDEYRKVKTSEKDLITVKSQFSVANRNYAITKAGYIIMAGDHRNDGTVFDINSIPAGAKLTASKDCYTYNFTYTYNLTAPKELSFTFVPYYKVYNWKTGEEEQTVYCDPIYIETIR